MKKTLHTLFMFIVLFFPGILNAKCFTDYVLENKFNDIVFVVYCEDKTDIIAMNLVMSTIYNRANSYDVNALHREISRKNQYYCYSMKNKYKKIDKNIYKVTYDAVCDFILNRRKPITKAKYFYNYKLVKPKFAKKLTPLVVYGSHIYLL